MNNETARERVTEAVYRANPDTDFVTYDPYPMGGYEIDWSDVEKVAKHRGEYDVADSVIAHLWQQAERPEVIEAEAMRLRDIHGKAAWDRLGEDGRDWWRRQAANGFIATLIALIGPRPTEQEPTND